MPIVFCNNVSECIYTILKERGISADDADLKIGIDAGGGFFKVCLSVICHEFAPKSKKRLCYGDGIAAKQLKDTGVKKLLILAIVPGMPEKYESVARVLSILKLDLIPSTFDLKYAADLKMINILLGLMSHSSKHPCSYCSIERYNLSYLLLRINTN